MNLAYRKFALLEKNFIAKEEEARIEGMTCTIDHDFKNRITRLLDQVRHI